MTETTQTAATTCPGARRSALDRATAMRLAAVEYQRFADLLRTLPAADWTRPTDCPAWDVRALATHVLGTAEMSASVREQLRQMLAALRSGGVFIDALTALQVRERADLGPEEVTVRFAAVAPRAVRGRRRSPALVRRLRIPIDQPVGDADEAWTFGYLVDVILTRDTWMHRMDIALATSRPPVLTADPDSVLVADIAVEWAQRHGSPVDLRLTGPAGGQWRFAGGGPELELDAVQFCRILSGRAAGTGLLAVAVPF